MVNSEWLMAGAARTHLLLRILYRNQKAFVICYYKTENASAFPETIHHSLSYGLLISSAIMVAATQKPI